MFADVYLNLLYVTVLLCMLVIGLTKPTVLLKYISVIDILHKAVWLQQGSALNPRKPNILGLDTQT